MRGGGGVNVSVLGVTYCDTLAPSCITKAAESAGAEVAEAEYRKRLLYLELTHHFIPGNSGVVGSDARGIFSRSCSLRHSYNR